MKKEKCDNVNLLVLKRSVSEVERETCLSLLKKSHNITSQSVTVLKAKKFAIFYTSEAFHNLIINIGNGLPSSRIPMGSSHCMVCPRPASL